VEHKNIYKESHLNQRVREIESGNEALHNKSMQRVDSKEDNNSVGKRWCLKVKGTSIQWRANEAFLNLCFDFGKRMFQTKGRINRPAVSN
jgi:hypothetical protein